LARGVSSLPETIMLPPLVISPATRARSRRKQSPYPRSIGKVLVAAARAQVFRWDRALAHVEREQEHALAAILDRAASTEIGRKHGFGRIRSHRDFVRSVPIGDYDTFSPFIERMRGGERGLLVPDWVRYYGNSSGSSTQGRPKFLPITERQIAHQRRAGSDTLMRYLAWSKDEAFVTGFTVGLFPPITMRAEGKTLITSNPALMMTRMPAITRPVTLPHDDVMRMTDYDEKLGVIAERYLDYDVRAVTGTTCWFTLLFEKVLEVARRRGRRAEVVSDVWPNLRVLLGGGVSAEPYLPIVKRLLGREDVTLVDTYNATEGGIYATTDFSGERGMLMLPHRGTFFEFVPLEERGRPDPTRIPLWAVEKDRPYVIVVTTTSGLYAYEIGDIVRFPSVSPPRIEFVGRLSGCLSLTQELTTHVEIERAVAYAIERCPCRTVDFGAGADVGAGGGAKAGYVLFAEFETEPANLEAFASAFDEGLAKENRVYREHRQRDVALAAPRVEALVRGGVRRFLDETTGGNVQGKFPRILDDARKGQLVPYTRTAAQDRSGS
jgi:hypothetical protein